MNFTSKCHCDSTRSLAISFGIWNEWVLMLFARLTSVFLHATCVQANLSEIFTSNGGLIHAHPPFLPFFLTLKKERTKNDRLKTYCCVGSETAAGICCLHCAIDLFGFKRNRTHTIALQFEWNRWYHNSFYFHSNELNCVSEWFIGIIHELNAFELVLFRIGSTIIHRRPSTQ